MSEPAEMQVDINEVLAEMPELGRALFDAAHQRVVNKRLVERIVALENEKAGATPMRPAGAA